MTDANEVTGRSTTEGATRRRWRTGAAWVGISLLMMWFWSGFWWEGHNGGDDFALYLDQGRSLIQGDVAATLTRTRYTVDNSAWHTFSPYAYPWGFPLMLAGMIAVTGAVDPVTGVDYTPFKLLVTACFLVALGAYGAMLRRRVGNFGSVVLPAFFAVNFVYVLHLDNVLSELPFMMALMLFIVAVDNLREREGLLGPNVLPLVMVGLLACFAFNIRREGLGLMFAIALAQAADIAGSTASAAEPSEPWRTRLARIDRRALATPWAAFIGGAVMFQILLPSDIAPRFVERDPSATSGPHRILGNLKIYEPLLAEQLGLKDLGPNDTTLFGSSWAGSLAFRAVIGATVIGIGFAVRRHPRRDLPVVGAFLGVLLFVLIAPFQTYRYIMALVPFLLYFAYQGVAIGLTSIPWRHAARLVVVPNVLVLTFIISGWSDTANARQYRTTFVGAQPGPQLPDALDMYQAVRRYTRGDDIVVANRARLMSFYTGRASVQGGAIEFVEQAGDYYVMYLEPDGSPGTYSQYPLSDEEARQRGFVEIWRNTGWVLWQIPPSRELR